MMRKSRGAAGADASYEEAVLTVSAAAAMAGMHAQTLRQYDRLGLVVPARTAGRGRRYSMADVDAVREVQRLSLEGINLEGVRRILDLEREVERMRAALERLRQQVEPGARVFAASATGDVEPLPRGVRVAARRPESGADPKAMPPRSGGAVVLWHAPRRSA